MFFFFSSTIRKDERIPAQRAPPNYLCVAPDFELWLCGTVNEGRYLALHILLYILKLF